MAEIRGNVSDAIAQKFSELQEKLGTRQTAGTLTSLINLLHLQFCSSNWSDMQAKAARIISAHKNFISPMQPCEVKRLQIDTAGVQVYTRFQGEPYRISSDVWEKG